MQLLGERTDRLNSSRSVLPDVRTGIDGLGVHFVHVRPRDENALPIIITHRWFGLVIELRALADDNERKDLS